MVVHVLTACVCCVATWLMFVYVWPGLQRQRTDPDGLTLDYKTQVPRPASSKKKKGLKARAQPAFVENYGYRNEDDDDF